MVFGISRSWLQYDGQGLLYRGRWIRGNCRRVSVSGGSITGFSFSGTGNSRGSGYTEAPQVVITGGGWRLVGGADAPEDGQVLSSDEE